ncbi:MAG: hypothetical protein IRZ26_01700 [Clostridia bacterium]|nr:hypothetical protein [Clostridia bacterium]MCL6521361.1 hypothetical protein [Bacillota bacterium]
MPSPASPAALGGQVYVFFLALLAGDAVGLLYDLFRATLRPARKRGWGDLLDLLFWLPASLLLATAMVLGNWLEFRFYPLLGVGAGLVLYFTLASPAVYGSLLALRRATGAGARRVVLGGRRRLSPVARRVGAGLRRLTTALRRPLSRAKRRRLGRLRRLVRLGRLRRLRRRPPRRR